MFVCRSGESETRERESSVVRKQCDKRRERERERDRSRPLDEETDVSDRFRQGRFCYWENPKNVFTETFVNLDMFGLVINTETCGFV